MMRKIFLGLLSGLFVILLFLGALDIGFARVADHPATVKRLVAQSGIYNSVVPNALAQTKTISTAYGDIPTSDPTIRSAAHAALSPAFIQQSTESAMDAIYDWLNGRDTQPQFNIDLSGAKILFANNIADSLQKGLAALPACSSAQSLAIASSGQFNAYNAACLPKLVNPSVVAEQVRADIVNNRSFLKNTAINPSTIKDSHGQSIFSSQLANAPAQYQRAKKVTWLLAILTVLTGAAVIFLSRRWQVGLRRIGILILIVGIVVIIFGWALNRTMNNQIIPKIKVDNAVFQPAIRSLAKELTRQIDKNYYFLGGVYAVIGAAALAGGEIMRRRDQTAPAPAKKSPSKSKGSAAKADI